MIRSPSMRIVIADLPTQTSAGTDHAGTRFLGYPGTPGRLAPSSLTAPYRAFGSSLLSDLQAYSVMQAERQVAPSLAAVSTEAYRQTARDELLARRSAGVTGFRDSYGYIVDYTNGQPDTLGEATLHTAIAIIALATGSYRPDSWEAAQANAMMEELLETVLVHSWGNKDSFGILHPIRHPDVYDYDEAGVRLRNRPMTKDGFNALVAAAYYAYDCPHSNDRVRSLARDLMSKWSQYLVLHQWRTHSNYLSGEFETDGHKKYKHIFSAPEPDPDPEKRRVSHAGPESFTLLPHEVYALKNCGARLGLVTAGWKVWLLDVPDGFEQMLIETAATYLTDATARVLDFVSAIWWYPSHTAFRLARLDGAGRSRGYSQLGFLIAYVSRLWRLSVPICWI